MIESEQQKLEGRSPFTEEFKQLYMNSLALTFKCEKCDFVLQYVHELNSYKEVLKTVKKHLIEEHGIKPQ